MREALGPKSLSQKMREALMHAYHNLNVLRLFMMWSLFVDSHSFLKNSQRFIFFFLLEGFKSEHSNRKEDRKFSFQFSSWEGLMLTTNRKDDCHWYKTKLTEDFELDIGWCHGIRKPKIINTI